MRAAVAKEKVKHGGFPPVHSKTAGHDLRNLIFDFTVTLPHSSWRTAFISAVLVTQMRGAAGCSASYETKNRSIGLKSGEFDTQSIFGTPCVSLV